MHGTPSDYDYLLLCDCSTIDRNNYPDLCDKLGGNVLPNLIGKFDQIMNPSSGAINIDIGLSLGFKKGEISSLFFALNNDENESWDRANNISSIYIGKNQYMRTNFYVTKNKEQDDIMPVSSRLKYIFLYRSNGTYNFCENRHNSYYEFMHTTGEYYKRRAYLDNNGNVIKRIDLADDNFDPFSPTLTFSSDSENENTETSAQSLEQSDLETRESSSSNSSINYYICYA